jgi:hypothetical protein
MRFRFFLKSRREIRKMGALYTYLQTTAHLKGGGPNNPILGNKTMDRGPGLPVEIPFGDD